MAFLIFMSNIEDFKSYSQFKSLKDFNNQVEMWMAEYKHIFTPSELIALKRLIRYAAKVPGISTARINTILQATRNTLGGVSRSTFKRMISKAKRIGMIEVKETVRPNMSQSSNLYIFQRFDTIGPPRTNSERQETSSKQQKVVKRLDHPKTNISGIKTGVHNNRQEKEMDHTFLPEYVHQSFIEIAKYYFDAYKIYKLWLIVLNAYKRAKCSIPLPEVIHVIVKAFKQAIFKQKLGKIHKSFDGYFYTLCVDLLIVEQRKVTIKKSPILSYNWLET